MIKRMQKNALLGTLKICKTFSISQENQKQDTTGNLYFHVGRKPYYKVT